MAHLGKRDSDGGVWEGDRKPPRGSLKGFDFDWGRMKRWAFQPQAVLAAVVKFRGLVFGRLRETVI